MILSFKCEETRKIYEGKRSRRFHAIQFVAERKLAMLDAATKFEDLKSPPGNRLKSLTGNRKGQFSIRINDQYRICFAWTPDGPADVEIVDYH